MILTITLGILALVGWLFMLFALIGWRRSIYGWGKSIKLTNKVLVGWIKETEAHARTRQQLLSQK